MVEDFRNFREAARAGISAAGAEPVLVNEDFPSLSDSPRNACLDAVDTCDYFVAIVGQRGGWSTPSGRLVVEEEYDRARERRIPVLVFLQDVSRDADADRYASRLSDFVDGTFRRVFGTPEDLTREIERGLRHVLSSVPMSPVRKMLAPHLFAAPSPFPSTPTLRYALSPERHDEVVDPVTLESPAFLDRVYAVAHGSAVRLLSYRYSKKAVVKDRSLMIVQSDIGGRHGEGQPVRLEVSEDGGIVIDAGVTGRAPRSPGLGLANTMVVSLGDVEDVLATSFRFAAAFYDEIDRFKRHQRFLYNVGLSGLEYRALVRDPTPQPSYRMSMRNRGVVLTAFDEGRLVDRGTLVKPGSEIDRIVALLVRKAAD